MIDPAPSSASSHIAAPESKRQKQCHDEPCPWGEPPDHRAATSLRNGGRPHMGPGRCQGFNSNFPMTWPLSSSAWARPASASGRRSWISGRMRPAARWSKSTVIAAARMSGRSSKLWIVKKRTAGLLAELARIAVTGVGRAVEAAVGDHHPERRQHIEIAAKALAADRVEDQIGAAASRKLAHAGDDILAAVVDRVLRAKSPVYSDTHMTARFGDQKPVFTSVGDILPRTSGSCNLRSSDPLKE